ncbi:2-succinylbenzoate--CoA ligase [Streptomyces alboniger]
MRDVAPPPPTAPPAPGGLADSVFDTAAAEPTRPVLARRLDAASSGWDEVTAAELRDEVVGLAKGLIASGISPGHRVAIMARTRYEWTVVCYALWAVGAEVVPIIRPPPRDQVEWILRDAAVVAVLVEDEQAVMTVGSVCASLPRLRHVWQLDAGALEELAARGEFIPLATVDSLRRIVLPDSTAVVAYTSGTSGRPLGCALSHRGLASVCDTLLAGWGRTTAPPGEQGSVLAFLPFSHVYGLMIQALCLRGGLLMGHEPELSGAALATALQSVSPHLFLCRAVGLREDLQELPAHGPAVGPRCALRAGGGDGPGLRRGVRAAAARRGAGPRLRPSAPARPVRADRVPQTAWRARRPGTTCHLGRLSPEPGALAVLRGHRHLRPRRVRTHRDQRRDHDAAAGPGEVRDRRAGPAGHRHPGRGGRGDPGARAVDVPGLRRRRARRPAPRCTAAGWPPGTSGGWIPRAI